MYCEMRDRQDAPAVADCELCGGEVYEYREELAGKVICPHCAGKRDAPKMLAAYAADDLDALCTYLSDSALCADKTVCRFLRQYAEGDAEDYFRFLKEKGV